MQESDRSARGALNSQVPDLSAGAEARQGGAYTATRLNCPPGGRLRRRRRRGLEHVLFQPRPVVGGGPRRLQRFRVEALQPLLHVVVVQAVILGDQIPARGLGRIGLDAAAVGEKPGKAKLRDGIVGFGGAGEPVGGGGLVLRRAAPVEQHDRVFDLGADVAVLRRLGEPARRLLLVGDDADAVHVEAGERVLRVHVAEPGGAAQIGGGQHGVLLNTLSLQQQVAELARRGGLAQVGGLAGRAPPLSRRPASRLRRRDRAGRARRVLRGRRNSRQADTSRRRRRGPASRRGRGKGARRGASAPRRRPSWRGRARARTRSGTSRAGTRRTRRPAETPNSSPAAVRPLSMRCPTPTGSSVVRSRCGPVGATSEASLSPSAAGGCDAEGRAATGMGDGNSARRSQTLVDPLLDRLPLVAPPALTAEVGAASASATSGKASKPLHAARRPSSASTAFAARTASPGPASFDQTA